MDVDRETVATNQLKAGHTAVGLVAVALTPAGFIANKGVLIKASGIGDEVPNTDPVWVGKIGVTADSDAGTGGLSVLPGGSIFLPVDDPSKLYVISTSASQDVAWIIM